MIESNKSYLEYKLKGSASFDSIKTQIDCTANDLNSDTTLCASNIFNPEVTEKCVSNDKRTNSSPKQWETVQTLDRTMIRSKQKSTTDDEAPKKANSSSNPLTYLKSALFSQKFKLKPQTSSSKTNTKRTIRPSSSLIISNSNRNTNDFRAKPENSCLCEQNICGPPLKQMPKVLYKCRSDESLHSNPNSVCSCLSNCDVCNDIFNNCYICQQLNKYYANSLKLKSSELFSKQLILSAINQISLAKCNCLSCVSHSRTSSASGNISDNNFIDSRLNINNNEKYFLSSGIS